jgi:anti-anti-sigma factor
MRSEALDITIESRGDWLWVYLSGPFHQEQVPNIREKLTGLIKDGTRRLVISLEQLTSVGEGVVALFLELLNLIGGKGGELKLIFKNEVVSAAFAPTRHIFSIHPDEAAMLRGGFLGTLRYQRQLLSRKTGVRLSRPVAIFLLIVLCGWFLTLGIIIRMQGKRIGEQEQQLFELTQWKHRHELELGVLRERLRPMEQLGLLPPAKEPGER